jgi:hypothetical protein
MSMYPTIHASRIKPPSRPDRVADMADGSIGWIDPSGMKIDLRGLGWIDPNADLMPPPGDNQTFRVRIRRQGYDFVADLECSGPTKWGREEIPMASMSPDTWRPVVKFESDGL